MVYQLVKEIGTDSGVIVIDNPTYSYGQQMWVRIKTRKAFNCGRCGLYKPKGTVAFRPFGNPSNRMDRVCLCILVK